MKVYYDFHIHSALSPCGDDENTPNNIAGMAYIKGLGAIAVTDHNSILNCAAVKAACDGYGITALFGAEITTAEDIHVLALFEGEESAGRFFEKFKECRARVKNSVKAFGHQYIMDAEDNVTGEEEDLLIVGCSLSLEETREAVEAAGGVAVLAHVDKPVNSVTAILGTISPEMGFSVIELSKKAGENFLAQNGLQAYRVLRDSDAHYLADISEAENFLEIEQNSPACILNYLRKNA